MRRLALHISSVLAAACVLSCSVKEDRSGAPCYLTVHLDDADPDDVHVTAVVITSHQEAMVSRDTLVIKEHVPQGFDIRMPRGWNRLAALAGNVHSVVRDASVVVPEGRNFDRLWIHRSELDCNWDTEHDFVKFTKEHTEIEIRPLHPVAGYYPYDMRLRSSTCGVALYERMPVDGKFSAYASRNRDGTLTAVLPRQQDDSMVLDILRPDGTIEISFQLGRMIAATGFDWWAENLDDITVTIDYASMDLSVKIKGWDDQNQGVIII